MTNFLVRADDQTISTAHEHARHVHAFRVSGGLQMATMAELLAGRQLPPGTTKLRFTREAKATRTPEIIQLVKQLVKDHDNLNITWWSY